MSYTIWDHCLEHFNVAMRHNDQQPTTFVEELVESLVSFLAMIVVDKVIHP